LGVPIPRNAHKAKLLEILADLERRGIR
jgi:hypothetical protein